MYKYLLIFLFLNYSCNNKINENLLVDVKDKAFSFSMTKKDNSKSNNINFSEKGAFFNNNKAPSYVLLDSLNINKSNNYNFSFWFQYTGEDASNEQMIFSVIDTLNKRKNINFWIAGKRITGKINTNNLWAKDYNYEKGESHSYYDLFQLELGKFYFLSINIFEDKAEVYINSELYASYEGLKETSINFHQIYFGVLNHTTEGFKYQFQGYLRNVTIFNKSLNQKEIETLSQETYQEIFPYNDAFELRKFKFENFE